MFKKQRVETICCFSIQTSTSNPRSTDSCTRVQEFHKKGTGSGVKLTNLIQSGRQQLATKHVVEETQGTQSTELLNSEPPVNHMDSERLGANSGSQTLVKDAEAIAWSTRDIPTGSNHAFHVPSPHERNPAIVP